MSCLGYFGEEYNELPCPYYNDVQMYKNSEYINLNVHKRDKNFKPMNYNQNFSKQYVQKSHHAYPPQVVTNVPYMMNSIPPQMLGTQFYNYGNCGMYQKTDSTTWIMKPKKYLRKSTTSIHNQDTEQEQPSTSTYQHTDPKQAYNEQSARYWEYFNSNPYNPLIANNGVMYTNFQAPVRNTRNHTCLQHNIPLVQQDPIRQSRPTTYESEVHSMQRDRSRNIYNCNCNACNNGYINLDFNKHGQAFTGKIFKGYDTTNSRGAFEMYNSEYMRRTSGGHSAEIEHNKNCDVPNVNENNQHKEAKNTDIPSGYSFDCSFEPIQQENDPEAIYKSYITDKSHRNYNNTVDSPRQRFNMGKFYTFKKPSYNCKFNYPSAHRYLKKMLEKTRRFYNLRANKKSKSLLSLKAASPSKCYKNERLRCFEVYNDGNKYVPPKRDNINELYKLNFTAEELKALECCQWQQNDDDMDKVRPYHSAESLHIKPKSQSKRNSLPTFIQMDTSFRSKIKPNHFNKAEYGRKGSSGFLRQAHSLVQLTKEGFKSINYEYNSDIVNNINTNCETPIVPSENVRSQNYGDIIENTTPNTDPYQNMNPVNVTAPNCLLLITNNTEKQVNINSIGVLDGNMGNNNFMFQTYSENKYPTDYDVEQFANNIFGITKPTFPAHEYQQNYNTQVDFTDNLYGITKPNSIAENTYRSCYSPEYLQSLKF